MFEDERKAKMGVVECVKHELVEPFNVLWERDGKNTTSSAHPTVVNTSSQGLQHHLHPQSRFFFDSFQNDGDCFTIPWHSETYSLYTGGLYCTQGIQ